MLKLCVICFCIGKPFDLPVYTEQLPNNNLCPKCENRNTMIPIDSPRAQKIIKEYKLEIKEFVRKPDREDFVWDKDYEPPEK